MAEQDKDLVCGRAVDPWTATVWSEYGGQRYFFCCEDCKRSFERNPGDYLSNL